MIGSSSAVVVSTLVSMLWINSDHNNTFILESVHRCTETDKTTAN